MRHSGRIALAASLLLGSQLFVSSSSAAAIQVLSAADLNSADSTTPYPGVHGDMFASPLAIPAGGDTVTFAFPSGTFNRESEGNGFTADFAPGTPLLVPQSTDFFDINFASGVTEAGLQVETGYTGFLGIETITAFDGATQLGQWSVSGTNNGAANGSAPFLGVRAGGGDVITRLRISNVVPDVPEFAFYFGFGPVTFGSPANAVPEPATVFLVLAALALLPLAGRLQRNRS